MQSNAICAISIAFSSEYISILIFNIGWPRYSFTWGYRARASLNRRVCVFFFNATEADWPVRLRTMHQDLKIQKSTKHCNDQNLKMAKSKCRFKRGATTSHFKEDEAASEEPPQKRRVSFRRLKPIDHMKLVRINADTVLKGGRDLGAETFERDESGTLEAVLSTRDLTDEDISQRKKDVRQLRESIYKEADRVASEHSRLIGLARCRNEAAYVFSGITFEVPNDPWALRELSLNSFAAQSNPVWFGTPNAKAERCNWRQWTNYSICGLSSRFKLNKEGNAIFYGTRDQTPWLRGQVVVQVGAQARATFGWGGMSQVMAQWRAAVEGLPWPCFRGISLYTLMQHSPGDLKLESFGGLDGLELEINRARRGQPGSQESMRFSQLIALRSAEERKAASSTCGPAPLLFFPRIPDSMCRSDWDRTSKFRDLPHSQEPEDFLRRGIAALGCNSSAFTELTQVLRGVPFYHSAVVRGKINKKPRGIPKLLLPLLPREEESDEEESLLQVDDGNEEEEGCLVEVGVTEGIV